MPGDRGTPRASMTSSTISAHAAYVLSNQLIAPYAVFPR